MQKRIIFSLLIICIGAIFASGCASTGLTNATMQATTVPTPATPNSTIITTIATALPTTVPTVNQTPLVMASYPTDVSKITFSHYTDSDYSVDYPSDWNISKSSYTAYYCENDVSPSSPGYSSYNYSICFANETKEIGPFDYYTSYSYAFLEKVSRIVTFTSPDGTLKFSSFVTDFVPNMIGGFTLKQTDDWCKYQFSLNYPDLDPSLYVTNYQYIQKPNGLMIATYDVTMPAGSKYYPLTYTKEGIVSLHHEYEFAFIDSNENSNDYNALDNHIISSITANDQG